MAYWDRFAKKKRLMRMCGKQKKRLLNYISKGKALTTKLCLTETGITELRTFKLFGFGSAPTPFFTWLYLVICWRWRWGEECSCKLSCNPTHFSKCKTPEQRKDLNNNHSHAYHKWKINNYKLTVYVARTWKWANSLRLSYQCSP